MTDRVGPVAGITLHQFYNDEAYWQGAWTEDEEFLDNGQVGGYRPFADSAQVSVVGGDVYRKSGERVALTDFFRAWLAETPVSVVVAIQLERRAELEKLLRDNGFTFAFSHPPEQAG
ncbi:hypothetical protein [Burkholderia cenocepacia]|uniref:hypothetical protein n=1 Tax=Burkholderia cenocepacia TaxID=95486 RepID=UPI00076D72E9|nr:hypothetical protein [Burkholderia cenocepacia]KWU19207.1 hypothetical protein AS149_13255 [Burkholderia cenocepacia]